MRDPIRGKDEILTASLESSSRQLKESTMSIEEIKSVLHWAKSPRERSTINIILDDQREVAKALGRLVDDLYEICNQTT